jgi:uncharacterized membrane protein
MMSASYLFALGIGVVAGLRSMTGPAAVSWAARLGWLKLQGSSFAFMGSTAAVAIFSLCAIGELIADKLPLIPKRTSPLPLMARILTGALCGACVCTSAHESIFSGVALGAIGAVFGAFGGYEIRRRLVGHLNVRDIFVAVPEDVIAIGLAWFFLAR